MSGHRFSSKCAHVQHRHGSHCGCRHGERHHECCEIPQSHCPPRIAGEFEWSIERGASAEGVIVVRNAAAIARVFTFTATPLAGVGVGSASLLVTPANATLQPDESVIVHVKLQNSSTLSACQDYRAEVVVKGAWEQAVRVVCRVAADPFDSCVIEQSDSLKDRVLHPESYKAGIVWQFGRGVVPEASITVFNVGRSAHFFNFMPTPLRGAEGSGAVLVATPDSATLSPGHSAAVRLELQHSEVLSPGRSYKAALIVRGFYDQRLHVHCHVERDAAGHVEIDQGDAPKHKRAHHWYDHFQCTEDCAPAAP
jgi:hypothetical protein